MANRALPFTFRQLRYLVSLEETKHFRVAAETCGISQPSLSVQIKSLEESLGLILVERGRGPVQLTQQGREIVQRAREILDAGQSVVDLAKVLQNTMGGTLRLGTSSTLGPYLMPHVIGALRKSNPELRLYIREAAPKHLIKELQEGRHDVILTQLPAVGKHLKVVRLFREPLMVALPLDHPLVRQENLENEHLRDQTILSLSPDYSLHDQISALCLETGAHLSREYEGTSLDALRQMVALNMGLSFLPSVYVSSEIEGRAEDVVIRPYRRRRFSRSIGLVWRSNSGATRSYELLAKLIRETAKVFPDLVLEG